MTGHERIRARRGRRDGRGWPGLWLVLGLWPVLLATAASFSCGAQPEGGEGPATSRVSETTSSTAESGGATGATSEGNVGGASKSTPEDRELDAQLISAAGNGDAEAVERLLGEGASVRARDSDGRPALVAAAYGNHLEVAEVLVEAGADVNAKDDTEQSAYLISTSEVGDDPRLLELTLENGADARSLDLYNGTGLIRAADRGYARIVGELLETDTDVDHVNELGWTALLEAIILGGGDERHTQVVRLLVEGGADPNLPDGEGVTPLQHARAKGYDEMAEILREAGGR